MPEVDAVIRRAIGLQIKQARQQRRWSQAKLADMLNRATGFRFTTTAKYVSKWERGERRPGYEWAPVIERVLDLDLSASEAAALGEDETAEHLVWSSERPGDAAGLMGRRAEAIRVVEPPVPTLVDSRSEDEDMRRRALLGLVGGAVLSGTVEAFEPVRRHLDTALAGPITEDDAAEWERAADHHSRLVGRFPTEQVLPGILADLDDLRRHVELAPDDLRPRLLGVSALLSGLSAISLVGAGHWAYAERYWRTAQRIAQSSEDRLIRCLVNSDRAVFSIYMPGCSQTTVLSLADEALGWTRGTVSKGAASALSARAQILSLVGDRTGAYAALNELETVYERLDGVWSEARLCHVRSFVYSHVGSTRESIAAQDQALALYPRPTSPGAVQIQMHRARSMIVSGDPSQGVRHIVTALEQAEPSFRRGYVGTSAEIALAALPQNVKRLPDVRHVRELTSQGAPS